VGALPGSGGEQSVERVAMRPAIMPASREIEGPKAATTLPCECSRLGSWSIKATISGHLPIRTFWAIFQTETLSLPPHP